MNAEIFVTILKEVVQKNSIESVLTNITSPPGRKPSDRLVEISSWFNNLNTADKKMIEKIIIESVETSVFGLLCVIDGVRAIEDGHSKGRLKLYYERNGEDVLLNDPDNDYLHDLLLT